MKYLNWVLKFRSKAFFLSFLALVITGLLMRPSSSCLVIPYTPLGIVDLELAFNSTWATKILEHWESNSCSNSLSLASNGLEASVINILLDFPFLIAYTGFFVVLVLLTAVKQAPLSRLSSFLIYLCLLIGLLDVIENFFMLIFILVSPISSYLFAMPAAIKFSLILVLIPLLVIRVIVKLVSKSRH